MNYTIVKTYKGVCIFGKNQAGYYTAIGYGMADTIEGMKHLITTKKFYDKAISEKVENTVKASRTTCQKGGK